MRRERYHEKDGIFLFLNCMKLTDKFTDVLYNSFPQAIHKEGMGICKMHKNNLFQQNIQNNTFQLIHIEFIKKRGKHKVFEKLSTLSTQKGVNNVNYYCKKKNERFVKN